MFFIFSGFPLQVQSYEEIADNLSAVAEALAPILSLPSREIEDALVTAQSARAAEGPELLAPFAQYLSRRLKYRLRGVGIDVDVAQYPAGEGSYDVVELEVLVEGLLGTAVGRD